MNRFVGLALFAAIAIGCGGAAKAPARAVSFRVGGSPPNASVTIDDVPVGPLGVLSQRGIRLPAGPHRITVEAPGYLPFDKMVTADQAPVALDVNLVAIPE